MHTITRSPSSIMLKSMMACPIWRQRRFSSLCVSRSIFSSLFRFAVAASAASAVSSSTHTALIVFSIAPSALPLARFHADGHFTIFKNFQLGNLHPHAQHAGQLHQAVGQFANQRFQQVHVFGGALRDDDLAHLAVVQHMVDVIVVRKQRLGAQTEFGVHLDRLGGGFFRLQNAQVGVKAQARQGQGLVTGAGLHAFMPFMRNTSTPTPAQSGYTSGFWVDRRTARTCGWASNRAAKSSHRVSCNSICPREMRVAITSRTKS